MAELWDLVDRVTERMEEGGTVFWKRGPYKMADSYPTKPRWHRLGKIERANEDRWTYRWTALCGYSFIFEGILGKRPEVKSEVRTAKLRCSLCDGLAAK